MAEEPNVFQQWRWGIQQPGVIRKYKVIMETKDHGLVTLHVTGGSIDEIIDKVENRRLPNADGMVSFLVTANE